MDPSEVTESVSEVREARPVEIEKTYSAVKEGVIVIRASVVFVSGRTLNVLS